MIWKSSALVSGGFFATGAPLLRIDPVDFEVALEQARANLARAESEDAWSHNEVERQRTLARQDVASASRLDTAENAARVAGASVRQARVVTAPGCCSATSPRSWAGSRTRIAPWPSTASRP